MSDLDRLDAYHRQVRRDRMKKVAAHNLSEIARAKQLLNDPEATVEEKERARIAIGTYAIDPGLMAGGAGPGLKRSSLDEISGHGNRHPHAPNPPTHLTRLQRLRRLLARRR